MNRHSKFFCFAVLLLSVNSVSAQDAVDKNLKDVYDLDSNRYTVIKIGKQYWLKENLRTLNTMTQRPLPPAY